MSDSDHNQLKTQLREFVGKESKEVEQLKKEIHKLEVKLIRRLAKFEPAIRLLEQLEGARKIEAAAEQSASSSKEEFAKLSVRGAGESVLRETRKGFSSRQLVEEIKKRGKPIKSKHSATMVSQALTDVPDVEKTKEGQVNIFRWKFESVEEPE
ncbi:MAG: hypothetical protein KAW02_03115 [candidate division Zixibacteria bacterium]|nr:hypothetical protein [candidate division Zixibacteria bacterium]